MSKIERRSLLKSICLAPLAAVFGKLKPAQEITLSNLKEGPSRQSEVIEFDGTSHYIHVAVVGDGKKRTIYINGMAYEMIGYPRCLTPEEIKQLLEEGKSG